MLLLMYTDSALVFIVFLFLLSMIIYLLLDIKNVNMENLKVRKLLFGMVAGIKRLNEKRQAKKMERKNREMVLNMEQEDSNKNLERVKVVKKRGIFKRALCLILIVYAGFILYKRRMINYIGLYASDRLIFSVNDGFCLLITYHPRNERENSRGFAYTHIPFWALFTKEWQAEKTGRDSADSEALYDEYCSLCELVEYRDAWGLMYEDEDYHLSQVGIIDYEYGTYFCRDAKTAH